MTTTESPTAASAFTAQSLERARSVSDPPTRIDRAFAAATSTAGLTVFLLMVLIGAFLVLRSRLALESQGASFLTRSEWNTTGKPPSIGVLGLLSGTVLVGIIAISIAIPISVLAALFIAEYAGPRLRRPLTGIVDLLAAVPSLLYGLWGFRYFSDQVTPLSKWLTDNLGWIPLFATDKDARFTGSLFIAGLVVSLMVLPIVTSISREVFSQTPPGEKEAALALGGTRWGMIRHVVLPYGKGGIIGGSMLGLGRALGETIAVSLLLPQIAKPTIHILQYGGGTIAGFIAQRAGGDKFTVSGLMAAGLVLFALTLATNLLASVVIARSRSGAGVEA